MKNEKNVVKSRLLTAVVAILAVIFVFISILTLHTFQDAARGYRYHRSFEDVERYVAIGDYAQLEDDFRYAFGSSKKLSEKEMALRAVTLYYNAARLYAADMEAGKTELASKQKARMDAALAEMGEFSGEAAKIDALFGLS